MEFPAFNFLNLLFLALGLLIGLAFFAIVLSWSVRLGAKFYPSFLTSVTVVVIFILLLLGPTKIFLPENESLKWLGNIIIAAISFFSLAYLTQWLIISKEDPTAKSTAKFKVAGIFLAFFIIFPLAVTLLFQAVLILFNISIIPTI